MYISATAQKGYSERLEGEGGGEAGQKHGESHRLAARKRGDANPAIVDFFSSPETDADISTHSFSAFRLPVKSLSLPVAKQQKQPALCISIRQ